MSGFVSPLDARGAVHRFVASNPGPKTLQGTNSYVVGHHEVYIIDPGPDDQRHLDRLVNWLRVSDRMPRGILLTHGHPDHVLGAPALSAALGVPIWAADTATYPQYATPRTARALEDTTLHVDDDTLHILQTPGHTPDSVSYFLESARIIFTGDTVLGHGSTVIAPPEGDMSAYIASLHVLETLPASLLAPGHGPPVDDPSAKLREYVRHRAFREAQLIRALEAGPATATTLVSHLYTDTPTALWDLAEGSVTSGLQKLENEGVVRKISEFWSLRGAHPQ